jgi:hypothetical protein
VAMLRMQTDGLLQLPPPRNGNHNGKPWHRRTAQAEPDVPLRAEGPRTLGTLKLQRVSQSRRIAAAQRVPRPLPLPRLSTAARCPTALLRSRWRTPRRLAQLRCRRLEDPAARPLYRLDPPAQRQEHLHRVVNNARFLILPWIECRNLASSILARSARQIAADWQLQYGYRPLLLETFVEQSALSRHRLPGCQLDLPWTNHRSRQARCPPPSLAAHQTVWVYPLDRHFRRVLCRVTAAFRLRPSRRENKSRPITH